MTGYIFMASLYAAMGLIGAVGVSFVIKDLIDGDDK